MIPTLLDCLEITFGEFFEYEDFEGNSCVEPKDMFMGCYADTSRGQNIYFERGYSWRWNDKAQSFAHPRSEVFKTKQDAFESAFENLYILWPVLERTEEIGDWFEYARNNSLSDRFIMDYVNEGQLV